MYKYKLIQRIYKVLNVTLTLILFFVYIFLANGFIEKSLVNKEIEDFKSRGVFIEEKTINNQIVRMYKVKKVYEYEDVSKPVFTYIKSIDDYYLGSKTDITLTSRNPMRNADLSIVSDICGFFSNNFYLGHATINITDNGSEYIESVGNNIDNMVKISPNTWIKTEVRGGDDTNRIIGLRIKNIDDEKRNLIIDSLMEKVGCEYNYNFFFPTKNKYYCTDLITRTLKEFDISLNYDGMFAIGNDIIIDNDTYLIYYIDRVEDGVFEFYFLSEE